MGAKHVIGIVGIVVIFVLVGIVYDLHRGTGTEATAQQPLQPAPQRNAEMGVVQGTVPNPPPVPVIPADDGIDNAMAQSAESLERAPAAESISGVNSSRTTAPAEQPVPRPRTYVVKSGDSLYSISRNVYGDTSKWRLIFEANRHLIKDKNRIVKGWELTIPAADSAATAPKAPVASVPESRPKEIAPEFRYTVKPGDTLESIAEKVMNNRAYARLILRMNRDRINDPKNLPPGLILEVPKMGKGN
ncbi:MAG: LysM peptidoglycan-binding domain-containing protein [Planctomycetota bacterium]